MKEKLELVHIDIYVPMSTSSLSGNKYFILFIDDLTRMSWVYFLSSKVQVFSIFKEFKAMVERESGCRLKYIRSDNETKYTSYQFSMYCKDLGIQQQFTVSYTPE